VAKKTLHQVFMFCFAYNDEALKPLHACAASSHGYWILPTAISPVLTVKSWLGVATIEHVATGNRDKTVRPQRVLCQRKSRSAD